MARSLLISTSYLEEGDVKEECLEMSAVQLEGRLPEFAMEEAVIHFCPLHFSGPSGMVDRPLSVDQRGPLLPSLR